MAEQGAKTGGAKVPEAQLAAIGAILRPPTATVILAGTSAMLGEVIGLLGAVR